MEKEFWLPIKGFEGIYEISNLGRIKILEKIHYRKHMGNYVIKEKIKSLTLSGQTWALYWGTCLTKNGKTKSIRIHRLLAQHFIENKNNLPCVNHIDGNKLNNSLNNLEWVSYMENNCHSKKSKKTSSSLTGVYYDKFNNKYRARIFINRKNIFSKRFETEQEAYEWRVNMEVSNGIKNKYL